MTNTFKSTVLWHDTNTAKARIKFEYGDQIIEDEYNLIDVVPGSAYTFEAMGLEFDKGFQLAAIYKLSEKIKGHFENGDIQTAPVAQPDDSYSAPVEPETMKETTKKKRKSS